MGPVSLSLWAILVAKFGLLFANDRLLPAFGVEYLSAASAAAMPPWPRYPYVAVLSIGRGLIVLEVSAPFCNSGAVEREFGRLKNEWVLARLRVRRNSQDLWIGVARELLITTL